MSGLFQAQKGPASRSSLLTGDGTWVGFFAEDELRRVPVSGGEPIRIARLPEGTLGGGSWGVDETILYCVGDTVYRIDVAGGEPVEYGLPDNLVGVTGREDQASIAGAQPLWPHILPGGLQVRLSSAFEVRSEPELLFSRPYNFFQDLNWTVRPDSQFVMIKSDPASSRQFRVVLNWFEELKERMGGG